MQIKIAAIESNARRNGQALINGIDVQVLDANLQGSDKQVAWAESIIADAVKDLAEAVLRKANAGAPAWHIIDAGLLDAEVAKLNASLAPMGKLAGTRAADWIDNRHLGRRVVGHMMSKGA